MKEVNSYEEVMKRQHSERWIKYLSRMMSVSGCEKLERSKDFLKQEKSLVKKIEKLTKKYGELLQELKTLRGECVHPLNLLQIEKWHGTDTLGNMSKTSEVNIVCSSCKKNLDSWTEW